eukprot:414057-Pelagomonas_calceolata.AAC.3
MGAGGHPLPRPPGHDRGSHASRVLLQCAPGVCGCRPYHRGHAHPWAAAAPYGLPGADAGC